MRFVEHGVYLIRLLNPWRPGEQSQYFEALEVHEYRGQYIVYGELRHDQIRPFVGVVETPAKPVAFPVFPNIAQRDLASLIHIMGGAAIGISEAPPLLVVGALKQPMGDELLLANCSTALAKVWGGAPWLMGPKRPNRDGLLKKCTKQVDAYLDWKRLGRWPEWFLADRAKARAPVSRN